MAITIPIFSNDKDMLFLTTLFSILVISIRKIFGKCIVRTLEDKNIKLINNSFSHSLNWDIIYPSLGIGTLIKIYYYHLS